MGAVVGISPYDWGASDEPPPTAGDYILSDGGTAYLVLEARLMARSAVPGRYALRCLKIGGVEAIPPGSMVMGLHWYRRDKGRTRS